MDQFTAVLGTLFGVIALGAIIYLFVYGWKRMTTNINYSCDLHLQKAHPVTIVSSWGVVWHRFRVNVDGATLFSGQAAPLFAPSGTANLQIDGEAILLRWRWSIFWGNPVYVLLERDGEILAKYGSDRVIRKIGLAREARVSSPQRITQSRLIREVVSSESVSEFASDEFPVDNRFGSDAVTIEQEVSKTLSTTLTCEEQELLKVGISATVVGVLKSQISNDLSRRLHLTIGETITKRHTVRISVRAGDKVVYELKWKNKLRDGQYLASVDGKQVFVPYQTCFGLTYELTSSQASL